MASKSARPQRANHATIRGATGYGNQAAQPDLPAQPAVRFRSSRRHEPNSGPYNRISRNRLPFLLNFYNRRIR